MQQERLWMKGLVNQMRFDFESFRCWVNYTGREDFAKPPPPRKSRLSEKIAAKPARKSRLAEKICYCRSVWTVNKKAQLSMTNTRDAKACQKLFQFDLQRCRWQYHLAVVAPEISEIPINSLKIQTYRVQGHPRSSIFILGVTGKPYATSY